MSYRAITDRSSAQYKLIHSEEITVCTDGLLRDSKGYVAVALGSYYSQSIGERFIVTFDNGNTAKFITCDQKADKDTINGANHASDNSMVEFIIDVGLAKQSYKKAISMGDFNYTKQFNGNIVNIEKVVEE